MSRYKFDDCPSCRFVHTKVICGDCDYGEQFEDNDGPQELDFENDGQAFARSNKSLVTDDDEPYHNPDDLVSRFDTNEGDGEEDPDED